MSISTAEFKHDGIPEGIISLASNVIIGTSKISATGGVIENKREAVQRFLNSEPYASEQTNTLHLSAQLIRAGLIQIFLLEGDPHNYLEKIQPAYDKFTDNLKNDVARPTEPIRRILALAMNDHKLMPYARTMSRWLHHDLEYIDLLSAGGIGAINTHIAILLEDIRLSKGASESVEVARTKAIERLNTFLKRIIYSLPHLVHSVKVVLQEEARPEPNGNSNDEKGKPIPITHQWLSSIQRELALRNLDPNVLGFNLPHDGNPSGIIKAAIENKGRGGDSSNELTLLLQLSLDKPHMTIPLPVDSIRGLQVSSDHAATPLIRGFDDDGKAMFQKQSSAIKHYLFFRGFGISPNGQYLTPSNTSHSGYLLRNGRGFVYDINTNTLYEVHCNAFPLAFIGNIPNLDELFKQGVNRKGFKIRDTAGKIFEYTIREYVGDEAILKRLSVIPTPSVQR